MCGRLDVTVIYLSLHRISCPVQLSVSLLLYLKSASKLSSAQDKYLPPLFTILSLQRPCSPGRTLRVIALSRKYFGGRAVYEAKASASYYAWKQKGNSSLGPFCAPAEAWVHSKCLSMQAGVWKESQQGRGIGTCWSLEALFVVGAACHGALCPPLQSACSKSGAQQSSCARKLRSGLKVGDWRSPSVMFFAWGRESSKNQRWPEGNPKAFKFWNPCSETSITSLNFEQAGQRHSLWKPFHLIRLSHVIKTAFDMVY